MRLACRRAKEAMGVNRLGGDSGVGDERTITTGS